MLFGCLRQNTNRSSENLKVIYIRCLMYYAIINYQFNTGELQNVQKLVKQTLQALLAETGNVNFCTTFEIIFLVDGPWKSNVVLEKSLKNGSSFFVWTLELRLQKAQKITMVCLSLKFFWYLLHNSPEGAFYVWVKTLVNRDLQTGGRERPRGQDLTFTFLRVFSKNRHRGKFHCTFLLLEKSALLS